MDLAKELGHAIPFIGLVGVKLMSRGGGRAKFELDVRPELTNSFDAAHGGVVMTLLDIAMAIAARSMDEKAVGAVTVEMKATFLGPAKGTITAEGVCLHHGKSVSLCEGEIKDAAGKVVARGSGTFMLRHRR